MSVIVSRSHLLKNLGLLAEEDAGRCPTLRPVAAMRPLEVVEAKPGLEVGVDRGHAGVVAVAKGDPVVEVEDGPLEALDEGVEVGRPGRDPVLPDSCGPAGLTERPAELGPVVGRRRDELEAGPVAGRHHILDQEAGHDLRGLVAGDHPGDRKARGAVDRGQLPDLAHALEVADIERVDEELNESREHVFLGIPWSFVSEVGAAAQEIAFSNDLLLYDPQSETAIVPPKFGGEPADWTAPVDADVEALANEMAATFEVDTSDFDLSNERDAMRALVREIEAGGGKIEVPMGFEVTEDIVGEVVDDPNRLPSKLQTPETKARLIANLRSPKNRPRMEAVTQLAGWDADDEVDTALREGLTSDDEFVRWTAASGLARHGFVDAFDEVLEVLRRASPTGEGDVGRMVMPTMSALELAAKIGQPAVERVHALVADWRGPAPAKPNHWDRELDRVLSEE